MNAVNLVVEKHAEDDLFLFYAIKSDKNVPRILQRNGKRGKEFVRSQFRQRNMKVGG